MNSNFNIYERLIAKSLSKMPKLKKHIKLYYSKFVYSFNKKKYQFKSNYKIHEIDNNQNETFFGYYDKSPLNISGDYLICHSSRQKTTTLPTPDNPIEILLIDFSNKKILKRFSSFAYNWQQGSRAQWLDSDNFIFNDYDVKKKKYISKIINVKKCVIEKIIDFPIYDTYKNFGISLNFNRLAKLRPDYGYRNQNVQKNIDLYDLTNDGIFYVDLEKNTQNLLLPLEEIIAVSSTKDIYKAKHKVNHIMISPDGSNFIFLHRYFVKGVKYDRLVYSNLDGSQVKILSDHEMISHCFWKDNNTIICFLRRYDHGDKYYEIDVKSGSILPLGEGVIDIYGDGHPNCYRNKMIFDTYPNRSRMKQMFVYDFKEKQLSKVGEFYESFKFAGETRCDLHQRWSMNGRYIFFDSVHTGLRKLYYIKLDNE